jgi:hypothetical protein
MVKKLALLVLIPCFFTRLPPLGGTPPVFPEKPPAVIQGPFGNTPLPDGYGNFRFGMTRTAVLAEVRRDPNLALTTGDFIEGFDRENWTVLVASGPPSFRNVYFLFADDKLFGIMLVFEPRQFSYYEVLHSLARRYGRPNTLGQDVTIWQNENVRLQLEHRVYLKYLDIKAFAAIRRDFDPSLFQIRPDKARILDGL